MRGNDATLAPLPFHAELKGLALLPKKVSIRAGEPYSLESDSGFLAYSYAQGDGGSMVLVPDLNFFAVVQQRADGRREVYRDIVLGAPPAALFHPPSDAAVSEPRGDFEGSRRPPQSLP